MIGPVQVHAPGEIDPERVAVVTELIVYLATRPGRTVSAAALDDVVWPNKAVRLSTRNEAISRARSWLGTDADGDPYLRRGSDGTVSLGPGLLVDWDLFTALTARGLAANGDGHRDLATALRLVRGQPFAHVPPRRYGWLPETYLEQDIAAAVVDTAHRLATQRLQRATRTAHGRPPATHSSSTATTSGPGATCSSPSTTSATAAPSGPWSTTSPPPLTSTSTTT